MIKAKVGYLMDLLALQIRDLQTDQLVYQQGMGRQCQPCHDDTFDVTSRMLSVDNTAMHSAVPAHYSSDVEEKDNHDNGIRITKLKKVKVLNLLHIYKKELVNNTQNGSLLYCIVPIHPNYKN